MNRWNNLIDLKGDSAPMEVINQRILSDATIEGTNLIVLVMAIMIACIGLNLNSVAVIIGAMLISPCEARTIFRPLVVCAFVDVLPWLLANSDTTT